MGIWKPAMPRTMLTLEARHKGSENGTKNLPRIRLDVVQVLCEVIWLHSYSDNLSLTSLVMM